MGRNCQYARGPVVVFLSLFDFIAGKGKFSGDLLKFCSFSHRHHLSVTNYLELCWPFKITVRVSLISIIGEVSLSVP